MPKEKMTCMGCDKKFQLLLSHLERTKTCQDFYDMSTMRQEAERLTKEKKAQRSHERYHNDPDESSKRKAAAKEYYKQHTPEKRAAAKEYYENHTPEKKATMALYNEKHREEINAAMKEQYQRDPEKRKAKSDYYIAVRHQFGENECPKCDQTFFTPQAMKSHIDHIHSNEDSVICQICDKCINHRKNIDRHMSEVHGGERHRCEKCPASFSRGSELQRHIKEGGHYLSYHCKQCNKKLVFKNLDGLIAHVIVKQSEGAQEYGGQKHKIYKSGILVTCKSQVESTQVIEGEHVLCLPREVKIKAMKKRAMKKEEIINEGLQSAIENPEAPKVKLEFEYHKHEEDGNRKCKWCKEHKFNLDFNQFCTYRMPSLIWILQNE